MTTLAQHHGMSNPNQNAVRVRWVKRPKPLPYHRWLRAMAETHRPPQSWFNEPMRPEWFGVKVRRGRRRAA